MDIIKFKQKVVDAYYANKKIILFNIGTDKVLLDSFGPMLGSYLEKELYTIDIYGTLENPVHALNISSTIDEIKLKYGNDVFIIATDACLTDKPENVGTIEARQRPVKPGAGAGKILKNVGDVSILAYVAVEDKSISIKELLNKGRLGDVYSLVKETANILLSIQTRLD